MTFHSIEIAFDPDRDALRAKLGLEAASDEEAEFLALLDKAMPFAKPRAAIGTAMVDANDETGRVTIGRVEFHSPLLAKNLEGVGTVWPYLATCGRELYDFVMAISDPFERYWGEEIMAAALTAVRSELDKRARKDLYDGKTAYMSPGSLADWPISQQVPLFELLGEAVDFCGVTLTDSMLMLPNKSVSGIRFPNAHGYVNCRLCPKEGCPNRRAAYDSAISAT